jgi:hypothetical protein
LEIRKSSQIDDFPVGGYLVPYHPSTKGEKRLFIFLLAVSSFILVLIAIFYALNPREIVGDALVNTNNGTPLEVPPPSVFPFYVKPVTIFFVASIVFSYTLLSLASKAIENMIPRWIRSLLLLISVAVFAISVYEVLFNFSLWGSILVFNPNPDLAVNSFPVGMWRTNLVFATKAYVTLLFVSYFASSTFKRSLHR